MLLEWLSDAETKLRFSGQLPEGDQETQAQIRDHERFVRELNEKQRDKDETITLAHSILSKAHPDAVTVIKHWITIIQSRWDEVRWLLYLFLCSYLFIYCLFLMKRQFRWKI